MNTGELDSSEWQGDDENNFGRVLIIRLNRDKSNKVYFSLIAAI